MRVFAWSKRPFWETEKSARKDPAAQWAQGRKDFERLGKLRDELRDIPIEDIRELRAQLDTQRDAKTTSEEDRRRLSRRISRLDEEITAYRIMKKQFVALEKKLNITRQEAV